MGKCLEEESGDKKPTSFLYHRALIAIQRGNSTSILGTLPETIKLDEI